MWPERGGGRVGGDVEVASGLEKGRGRRGERERDKGGSGQVRETFNSR